jgi:prephenate dehydrogenase
MKALAESRVAIVGLGLMGGSLAGALRGKCRAVIGVARRDETLAEARAHRLIDEGTTELADGVGDADIAILATPVRTIIELARSIGPLLPAGALLLDLGSTKTDIVSAMAELPPHVQPLGGHPMCGKELSGITAADPRLYQGKTFILTPLPRTAPDALALGKELVAAIGAQPLVLEPARHDRLVGVLSHLPYLLACALVRTADATTSADPAAWEIVATGFRDTSRVAASDVTMMTDILLTNRDAIIGALAAYRDQLDFLMELVRAGDEGRLRAVLSEIRATRKEMFP